MRRRVLVMLMVTLAVTAGGCATREEWTTWNEHPTHFASGDHMVFSVRNREGRAPRVARKDITLASNEGWWGKALTVAQEQILER